MIITPMKIEVLETRPNHHAIAFDERGCMAMIEELGEDHPLSMRLSRILVCQQTIRSWAMDMVAHVNPRPTGWRGLPMRGEYRTHIVLSDSELSALRRAVGRSIFVDDIVGFQIYRLLCRGTRCPESSLARPRPNPESDMDIDVTKLPQGA